MPAFVSFVIWTLALPVPVSNYAMSWRDIVSYKTFRVVRIRDTRLGLLHWGLLFMIFAYIVGHNFLELQKYQKVHSPVGSIRTTLKLPEEHFVEKNPAYCGAGTYEAFGLKFPQAQCHYDSDEFVVYPRIEVQSLLAASHVIARQEARPPGCSPPTSDHCSRWIGQGKPQSFFIPDLDRFTLFIDHTMSVTRETGETSSKNAIDMDGRLVDAAGKEMEPCKFYHNLNLPCPPYVHVGASGLTDIVPLGALLLSAGVTSLDQQSIVAYAREIAGHHHQNTTYRAAGMLLIVYIEYSNRETYDESIFRYKIRATRVSHTQFKAVELEQKFGDAGSRLLLERHGIRILFLQTGQIGFFDGTELMVQLASAGALMTGATFMIDMLAIWVFKQKDTYRKLKFDDSDDHDVHFGDDSLLDVPIPHPFDDEHKGPESESSSLLAQKGATHPIYGSTKP